MAGRVQVRNLFDTFGNERSHRSNAEDRLQSAVEHGDVHVTASLLRKGVSPNLKIRGESYLIHTAVERSYLDIVFELLAAGADVNTRDGYGQTPLLVACRRRFFSVASLLLRYCADISIRDKNGRLPLSFTHFRPMGDVLERCIQQGSTCPPIPPSLDFVTAVRRRALKTPPPPRDMQIDVHSKRDMEMLYFIYMSAMSLGGYYKVCRRNDWHLVHRDSTGSRLADGTEAMEYHFYRHYLLLVEDELLEACPPSPRLYREEEPVARNVINYNHRTSPVPPRAHQSSVPAHHPSHRPLRGEQSPRSPPPAGLSSRPTATRGEPSDTGSHHRDQRARDAAPVRGSPAPPPPLMRPNHRDPRLNRTAEKRPRTPTPPPAPAPVAAAAPLKLPKRSDEQSGGAETCWSTSGGLGQASSRPNRTKSEDAKPVVRRSVFDSFLLPEKPRSKSTSMVVGTDVKNVAGRDGAESSDAKPSSNALASERADRENGRGASLSSGGKRRSPEKERGSSVPAPAVLSGPAKVKLKMSSTQIKKRIRTAGSDSIGTGTAASGSLQSLPKPVTAPPLTLPLSPSRNLNRHSTPVLERMAAILQDEPCPVIPAPADSTTSDLSPATASSDTAVPMPPVSQSSGKRSADSECGSNSHSELTLKSNSRLPVFESTEDGDSVGSLVRGTAKEPLIEDRAFAEQERATADTEDSSMDVDPSPPAGPRKAGSAAHILISDEDEEDMERENDGVDNEDDVISVLSDTPSPLSLPSSAHSSPGPNASSNGDDDGDGDSMAEDASQNDSQASQAARPRARELERLALSPPPRLSPPKEVVLPEFITDPRYLSREQRKLQQTLQHFQVMEMRASAKANRLKRKHSTSTTHKPSDKPGERSRTMDCATGSGTHRHQDDNRLRMAQVRSAARAREARWATRSSSRRSPVGHRSSGHRGSSRVRAMKDADTWWHVHPTNEKRDENCDLKAASNAGRMSSSSSTMSCEATPKVRKVQQVKPFVSPLVGASLADYTETGLDASGDAQKAPKKFQDFQPTILPTRSRSTTAAASPSFPFDTCKRVKRPADQLVTMSPGDSEHSAALELPAKQRQPAKTLVTVNKAKRRAVDGTPKDARGEMPLHRAARNGDIRRVERFLGEGMEVNCQDNAGWMPLHEAINKNHVDIAEILLQHGACADPIATDGTTPLDDAMESNSLAAVQLLLRYGADPTRACNATKLTIAEDSECAKVFKEALAVCKSSLCRSRNMAWKSALSGGSHTLPKLEDVKQFEPALRSDVMSLVHYLRQMSADMPAYYAGAAFEVSDGPYLPIYSLAVMPNAELRHNYVLLEDVLEMLDCEMEPFLSRFPAVRTLDISMTSFRQLCNGSLFNPPEPLDPVDGEQREDDEELSLLLWNDTIRSLLGVSLFVL